MSWAERFEKSNQKTVLPEQCNLWVYRRTVAGPDGQVRPHEYFFFFLLHSIK